MNAAVKNIGGCLPSPDELVFLKACLSPPEEAKAAWAECLSRRSLDELEGPSFHLLPLLYRNLQRAEHEGPEMPRLKGLYRRNWYASQKRFHMLENVIAQFHAHKIPVIVLKGSALSFLYYPDPYTRAMMDGDILVPMAQAEEAVTRLRAQGWNCKIPMRRNFTRSMNGNAFTNAAGDELDVHWHLFLENCGEKNRQIFWQRAVPMEFRAQQVLTLSPSDHLFHTCIHGYKWNPVSPMRWVADASLILEKSGDAIEWDHIVGQARIRNFSVRLHGALAFLCDSCGLKIPARVFTDLQAIPVPKFERFEHRIVTREGKLHQDPLKEFVWPLQRLWCLHRRLNPDRNAFLRAVTFPSTLRTELAASTRLSSFLLRAGFRKLKRLWKSAPAG
ncbi:MAG: nucleotidyltransferase family protein [Alphaproteobacteria bacterium]|nr:nucleotidyltransferase family protein [Alphaproteobacteria bacterium]